MKKIILILSFFVALSISYSFSSIESSTLILEKVNNEDSVCKYAQCSATAKSTRNRCKHCVSNEGDVYCWQHD